MISRLRSHGQAPGDHATSAAYVAFARASSRALFAQALLLTGDAEAAKDLTQETLLRVWQRWHTVAEYESPFGFASRVLHNLATNEHRRRSRVRRRDESVQVIAARAVPPLDAAHLDVVAALRRLPSTQRRAIVLHHLADLPVRDVAASMAVPEGTVRAWLAKGRAALADALASESGSPITPIPATKSSGRAEHADDGDKEANHA